MSDLFIVSTLDGGYLENLAYTLETLDARWSPSHSVIINLDDEETVSSMKVMNIVDNKDAHDGHNHATMVMSSKPDILSQIKSEFSY